MRIVVWIVVLLALYYFAASVVHHWSSISDWRPGVADVLIVASLVCFYSFSLLALAEVWHRLVSGCQAASFTRAKTYHSYSVAQVAKYLPGNVFHFVGRHLIMTKAGASQLSLTWATLFEIGTMVVVASMLTVLGIGLGLVPAITNLLEVFDHLWVVIIIGLFIPFVFVVAAQKWSIIRARPNTRELVICLCLSGLCFLLTGFILFLLVTIITGEFIPSVIIAAILSWVIGFVTPGAPGGIGVREIVLLMLLGPELAEPQALLVIGLFRLVTTLGDFLLFCLGAILWGKGVSTGTN